VLESDGLDKTRDWLEPARILLRVIEGLGGHTNKANVPGLLDDAVWAKKWYGGSAPILLIVDEAHRCGPRTLQVLRDLMELLEVGLALVGEPELLSRFRRHGVKLASLRNRVTGWLPLEVTDGDLRARISHHNLPQTAFTPLRGVANLIGLHGVQTVIEEAGGEPITREMLVRAAKVITGNKELAS
jgi:DNA transposition AAA+ family ATPase